MARAFKLLLLILWVFSAPVQGSTQGAELLKQNLKEICFALAVDHVSEPTPQEAIAFKDSDYWQPCNDVRLARGYTNEGLWLRIPLVNDTSEANTKILDLYMPWLKRVHVFAIIENSVVTQQQIGSMQPFDTRDRLSPSLQLDLSVQPYSEKEILLYFHGKEGITVGGFVLSERGWMAQTNLLNLLNGGMLAGVLILVLYNSFLYLSLKDPNYLLYAFFCTSMIFSLGAMYGFNHQLFWPAWTSWNAFSNAAAPPISSFFMLLFIRRFLSIKEELPGVDRVIVSLISLSILMALFAVIESTRYIAFFVSGPLAAFGGICTLLASIIAWRQGQQFAKYITFGWLFAVLGVNVLGLTLMGLIEFNFWAYYAVSFGVLLEMSLFSLALARKIKTLQDEKLEAQETAFEAERQLASGLRLAASELEQKVSVRTSDLTLAKKLAESMARTDELTGLGNRRHFFEAGEAILHTTHELGGSFTLLMIDIDRFKRVNDQYGHGSGDVVLKVISHALRSSLTESAVLSRIGGEEFGNILPNSTIEFAIESANKLCDAVSELTSPLDVAPDETFTISVGGTHFLPSDESLDEPMYRADVALYRAKSSGRNRVEVTLS